MHERYFRFANLNQGNPIGVEGAQSLAHAIPGISSLTHLDLAHCGLGLNGVNRILDALKSNVSNREL